MQAQFKRHISCGTLRLATFVLLCGLVGWCEIAGGVRADEKPVVGLPEAVRRKVDFVTEIQPLLAKACYQCHGPEKQTSGFRLDQKKVALRGGNSGAAIVPGKSAESRLVQYVAGLNAEIVMPPRGDRLTPQQISLLRGWIDQGAEWPDLGGATASDAAEVWWSFRPLVRPAVPELKDRELSQRVRNPIDAFVLQRLQQKQLTPSPEADRRTLIRRLSFDLIGLPPTPREVDEFLNDRSPDAYERLVDRLLASPHYGERWARHWLDVVHYGDTHGYDKDKPRPHAWPYRDYVIRAFNQDKPYGRFVQEQIAGDVLFPGTVDGIEALGFIAAGPWDFIGHAEVPESKIDGKIARHLDRDDMISNTINTFVSLTVQCAQCHNHKFDPISQEDYYRLQAVFAALDRADRRYYPDPQVAEQVAALEKQKAGLTARISQTEAEQAKLAGAELADLDRRIAAFTAAKKPASGERPEFGYHSAIEKTPDKPKWIQLDLGQPRQITRVEYVGCHDNYNNIGAGFGFPVRFKIEASDDAAFQQNVRMLLDRTQSDVPNPGVTPLMVKADDKIVARHVRFTATRLAPRQNDFIFALAELSVFDEQGQNVALKAKVTALDSIEAAPRWRTINVIDEYYYGKQQPAETRADLAELQSQRRQLLEKRVPAEVRQQHESLVRELKEVENRLSRLPKPKLVYSGTVHHGTGTFAGTGAQGGKPRPIHLLKRGDVRKPAEEVGPGTLRVFADLPAVFVLPNDATEGDRRAHLASWLTDPRNVLTWRSIVNRMWRYHFGRGLVESPNDFGRMGQLPTHPELLDWLAVELRDQGQSLKRLHRLIVCSATYRQVSTVRAEAAVVDVDNAWYWRMNRRRLEAEAIRDTVLAVAGKLDPRLYGEPFQEFVIEKPEHSPHYQYHLHDPNDPRAHRRSIYRFLVRSQQQPFMTTLDCADPSMQVDRRNETLSPLQALSLLNNRLMLTMSQHFAARLQQTSNDVAVQVETACRLALGRPPTAEEQAALIAYARQHGLANTCRLVFNLNEFLFID